MKYLGRKIIFFLIILIPFWSFLVWFFYPKTELPGLILDKTVLESSGVEHRSFNWITTNRKFTKPDGSQYEISEDYYGFFPVNRPEYVVKDLTVFSKNDIDSLSRNLEYVYYTDAYGIYTNEWVYGRDINERSRLIYGGLSQQSYKLFEKMFRNRKLTITEFNNLASPTPLKLRFGMQRVLESDFSGWTGRYYHSLDTLLNPDIPDWMKRLHKQYLNKPFSYPDVSGIVLVHETERILVLRLDMDLEHELPIINTGKMLIDKYDLPEFIRYPYWFDICFAKDTADIFASYKIHTTERGDSVLNTENLPNEFPAIIGDNEEHLRWYFCGDWADSPTPFGLSYFKGVQFMRKFFYNNRDDLDRKKFFWEYYEPLVSGIFNDYIAIKDSIDGPRPLPSVHKEYKPYYRRFNLPLPDVDLIASGRVYDPNEILGSEYNDRAYRDSVLQAEKEEAAATGYYIGRYGDTIYLTDNEIQELEDQTQYEESVQSRRDSVNRRRLDSIRGVGIFADEDRLIKIDSDLLRGGRLPRNEPLTKAQRAQRIKLREDARDRRANEIVDSMERAESPRYQAESDSAAISPEPTVIPNTQSQVEQKPASNVILGTGSLNSSPETEEDEKIDPDILRQYTRGGRMPRKVNVISPIETEEAEVELVEKPVNTEPKEVKPAVIEASNINPVSSRGDNRIININDAQLSYHIIIASFPEKQQALKYLDKKNDSKMRLIYSPQNGVYRVSYRSFADAPSANREVLNLIGEYRDAWVKKIGD